MGPIKKPTTKNRGKILMGEKSHTEKQTRKKKREISEGGLTVRGGSALTRKNKGEFFKHRQNTKTLQ